MGEIELPSMSGPHSIQRCPDQEEHIVLQFIDPPTNDETIIDDIIDL